MKLLLPTLFALLWGIAAIGQTTSKTSIFFDLDKSDLSTDATSVLQSLATELAAAPDYDIQINAYTDDQGTSTYNDQLAQQRGLTVAQLLAQKGIIAEKTTVSSWGEKKQTGNLKTEENRRQNRRVDLEVTTWAIHDAATFFERLRGASKVQIFKVDPSQNQTITAQGGVVVIIPADALEDQNGNRPTGPVDVHITEALSPGDWLAHNLATTSNGKLLQSGGMVNVEAFANGQPLRIADGADITLAMPASKGFDPDMRLFYGTHTENAMDSTAAAQPTLDWSLANDDAAFRDELVKEEFRRPLDAALAARIRQCAMPIAAKPAYPEFAKLDQPRIPIKPSKPRVKATPPSREEVNKRFTKNGTMTKKQQRLAHEEYQRRYAFYLKDSVVCARNLEVYTAQKNSYEADMAEYQADYKRWHMEMLSQTAKYVAYRKQLYQYYVTTVHNVICKKAGNEKKRQQFMVLRTYIANRIGRVALGMFDKDRNGQKALTQILTCRMALNLEYAKKINRNEASMPVYAEGDCIVDGGCRGSFTNQIIDGSPLVALSDSLYAIDREKILQSGNAAQKRQKMSMYITEITQMGWINCDKFYQNPEPLMTLAYEVPKAFALYAYFPNLRSMMLFSKNSDDDELFTLSGIPKGQRLELIAIKTENGQVAMSRQNMVTGQGTIPNFAFKPCSMRDLKSELATL